MKFFCFYHHSCPEGDERETFDHAPEALAWVGRIVQRERITGDRLARSFTVVQGAEMPLSPIALVDGVTFGRPS